MQTHSDFNIRYYPDKCTGCRICQLICSSHFGLNNPSESHLKIINPYGVNPKLYFLESCTRCGLCVQYCIYNALVIVEENNK